MKLFGMEVTRAKAAPASMPVPAESIAWAIKSGLAATRYNYEYDIGPERLTSTSIIAAVLGWILRTFPEAPVVVKKRVDPNTYEIVDEHGMAVRIEEPNPWYSSIELWNGTLADWWLDGNAYWLKYRDAAYGVEELWWCPSWMIEPKGPTNPDNRNWIEHYEYKPAPARRLKLDPKDVVHFRNGLDPRNPRKGLSRVKALFREVASDEEASNFTASILRNMGVPGLVVSPRPKGAGDKDVDYYPDQDEADAMKEYFRESFTGDRRGDVAVSRTPVELLQFGFSPEQLDLRNIRRIPEERVSGVVGVAAIVAGLGAGLERSTFANYAEAREASYEENIIPTQRSFSAVLKSQFLPDFERDITPFRVAFDTSDVRILQEDKNSETARIISQFQGSIITLAEARGQLGWDFEPEHEVLSVQLNRELVPIALLGQYSSLDQTPEAQNPSRDASNELPPKARALLPAPNGNGKVKSNRRRNIRRDRHVAQLERYRRQAERRLHADMTDIFDELGQTVSDTFVRVMGQMGIKQRMGETLVDFGVPFATPTTIDEFIDSFVQLTDIERAVLKAQNLTIEALIKMRRFLGELTFIEAGDFFEDVMVWNDDNPRVAEVLNNARNRARQIRLEDSIMNSVRRTLHDNLPPPQEPGKWYRQDVDWDVRKVAKSMWQIIRTNDVINVISRTETQVASNELRLVSYEISGDVEAVILYDNLIGYDDEECMARDGEVYTFEQASQEVATEHPNGTLTFGPVVREFSGVWRPIYGEGER